MLSEGVVAELVHMEVETATVPAAAAALGVLPAQIVKSLLFRIGESLVLVVAPGDEPVPRRPLADRFQVGKKQIRLADAATVLDATGYSVGGVPPVCSRRGLRVVVDRRILEWEVVYGGGGDDRTLLRIAPAELLRVTNAECIDLSE